MDCESECWRERRGLGCCGEEGGTLRLLTDRRQQADHDCGPTAAATALDLLGLSAADASAMVSQLPCTPSHGTDPATLEAYFRTIGKSVQSGEMTTADLAHHTKHNRPVLCAVQHEGGGHWVTVFRVSFGDVWYHCPIDGVKRVSAAKFRRSWWDWDRRGGSYPGFGLAVWG